VRLFVSRSRRTLESRQNMDDDKISMLEEELRKAKAVAIEAERNYEEVLFTCFIFSPFTFDFCFLILVWSLSCFFSFQSISIRVLKKNCSLDFNVDFLVMNVL